MSKAKPQGIPGIELLLIHELITVYHVSVHDGNGIRLDLPIAQSTFLAFIKSTRSKKLFL